MEGTEVELYYNLIVGINLMIKREENLYERERENFDGGLCL